MTAPEAALNESRAMRVESLQENRAALEQSCSTEEYHISVTLPFQEFNPFYAKVPMTRIPRRRRRWQCSMRNDPDLGSDRTRQDASRAEHVQLPVSYRDEITVIFLHTIQHVSLLFICLIRAGMCRGARGGLVHARHPTPHLSPCTSRPSPESAAASSPFEKMPLLPPQMAVNPSHRPCQG